MSADTTTRIPFVVLTGFLGSGKTTLLRGLLALPEMDGTAIIVNELGDIGIDDALIEQVDEATILLKSGCVCCSIRGDLVATLKALLERVNQGKLQQFKRVVLETTGLADPAPVIHTLMTHPEIATHFFLEAVVTTLDSTLAERTLDRHEELQKQIALADTIVLTKTDLETPKNISRVAGLAKDINPRAVIIRSDKNPGPKSLFEHGLIKNGTVDTFSWLGPDPVRNHMSGIKTFSLSYHIPLDWRGVADAFDLLIQLHGNDLLRVKGILNITNQPLPVVVQGVQHIFYPPALLEAWQGEPSSRLVFITRGIDSERIKALMQPLLEPVPFTRKMENH